MLILRRKRWLDRPRSLQTLLDVTRSPDAWNGAPVDPTTSCSDEDARILAVGALADIGEWRDAHVDRPGMESEISELTEQVTKAEGTVSDLKFSRFQIETWLKNNWPGVWDEFNNEVPSYKEKDDE